ncbi:MAG: alpha/beta hydrolase [Chlamydiales bacterium]|nr:alpha/beta hydrolase [Chlamydiales bacterium]
MKKIAYAFLVSLGIWLLGSLSMLAFSQYLIYSPDFHRSDNADFSYQQDFITNSDNDKFQVWFKEKADSDEVVLYLHGTGGRNPRYVKELSEYSNVLSPSYPGFEPSEGTPSTKTINEAAHLCIKYLKDKGFKEEKITVWGQSLGGSPSLYLAMKYPNLKKVVLINTFDSIKKMGMRRYGPLAFFANHIHNSMEFAKKAKAKIRQYHVIEDEVVPFVAGANLYKHIASDDKKFIPLEKGTHNEFDVWTTLFVEEVYKAQFITEDNAKMVDN